MRVFIIKLDLEVCWFSVGGLYLLGVLGSRIFVCEVVFVSIIDVFGVFWYRSEILIWFLGMY